MMHNILISIIIPVYNNEDVIDNCIINIINQKLSNVEIILVDNGSTDQSIKICDYYSKKYRNIIFVHHTNQGFASACNTGLEIAHGQYINFLDPRTDIRFLSYIDIYKYAIYNKADIVISKVIFNDKKLQNLNYENKVIEKIKNKKVFNWRDIGEQNIISNKNFIILSNKIFRKNFLEEKKIRFLINKCFGHIPFYFHTIFTAKNICYSRENKIICNIHYDKMNFQDINNLYYFDIIKEIKTILAHITSLKKMSFFYNYIVFQIIKHYFMVPKAYSKKYLNFARIYLPYKYYIKMLVYLYLIAIKKNFSLIPIKKTSEIQKVSLKIFNLFPIVSIRKTENLDNEYDCIVIIGCNKKNNLEILDVQKNNIFVFESLSLEIIKKEISKIKKLSENEIINLSPPYNTINSINDEIKFLSGALSISNNIVIIDVNASQSINSIYEIYYKLNSMFYEKKVDIIVNFKENTVDKFLIPKYIKLYSFDIISLKKLIQKQKYNQHYKTKIFSILEIPFIIVRKKI